MAIIPQPSSEDRASGGQRIDGSLTFDRRRTPKLKRTFTTAGNRKTWTWSGWVRKDELDDGSDWLALFLVYPAGTSYAGVKGYHNLADDIGFSDIAGGSINSMVSSNRLLRDLGWYHIVCILDTTQSTNTDRVKLWVNGERITSIYSGRVSYLSQNEKGQVNTADAHYIGAELYNGGNYASDCTMSQCYFIDGLALDASNFGYTDPLTNTWRPKKYTGNYNIASYDTTNATGGNTILNTNDSGSTVTSGNRTDSNSSYLKVAVPMNGSNDGTTFTDVVGGHTCTANGNVHTDTGVSQFYGSSAQFDGTGDYIDLGTHTDWSLDGDFTIECWMRINSTNKGLICTLGDAGTSTGFEFYAAGINDFRVWEGGSGLSGYWFGWGSNPTAAADEWGHYALVRESGVAKAYVNGEDIGKTFSTNTTYSGVLTLGAEYSGGSITDSHDGYLADFRLYKGVAKYTSNFNLPGSGTGVNSFYLPFDGNSPIGKDQSGNGNDFTPINFGGSTVIPKATGALPILNTVSGGKVAVPGVRGQVGVAVTVYNSGSGNKYYLDGEEAKTVSYKRGQTVTFDTSDGTVAGHPFRFATAADAAGSTQYTTGSVTSASEGSVGAATTITFPIDAPETLYYYCTNHSGMGGSITGITTDIQVADPYASYCKLAVPLLTDVSNQVNIETTASTLSNSGVDIVATHSNFYGASGDYTGAATDYLETGNDDTKFKMEEGDFTVECWVYSTTTSGTQNVCQIIGDGGSTKYYGIWWNGSNLYFQIEGGCGSVSAGDVVMGKEEWHHLAMTRTGGKMRGFVDGVKLVEANDTLDIDDSGYQAWIGRHESANNGFTGYIQDFRIYKGVAKYTSNFIPASTNPDILQDNPSGVAYSSELIKPTTGAVAFDGSGDYLSLASTSDFDFGTGDFTIELWANCGGYGGSPYLFDFRTDGSNTGTTNKIVWYVPSSSGKPTFWTNGSSRIIADNIIALNSWVHLALVRSSGTTTMYIDGSAQSSTYSDTTDYGDGGSPVTIGQRQGTASQSWDGFLSNVRIVKGTAVYTQDFTPPSGPLTNITNTKLLCCQSSSSASTTSVVPTVTDDYDAGVYLKATTYADRGGSSCTVSNNGSVTSSSAGTNPFGITDAAAITGTQRIDIDMGNVSGTFFQSAWTLEMFFKTDDITEDNWFIGTSDTGASWNTGWSLDWQGDGGGTLLWNYSNSNPLDTNITASSNTWYFLRVQRTPGSGTPLHIQLYDGPNSLVGSYTGTATDGATHSMNVLKIGDANGNSNNLDSNWMYSNVMLTAGTKSNQTVPTLSSGQRVDGASVTASLVPYGNSQTNGGTPKTMAFPCNLFDNDMNAVLGQETGYCTWNLLDKSSNQILFDGLLTVGSASNAWEHTKGTIGFNSGKYYWEIIPISSTQINLIYGISDAEENVSTYPGGSSGHSYVYGGSRYDEGTYSGVVGSSWVEGDVLGVAVDCDGGIIKYYINNILQSFANISTTKTWFPSISVYYSDSSIPKYSTNFGQKPFRFAPPEGFLPLNFSNIPRPTLPRPDQYVKPVVYTGNDSSNNSGTGNTWGIPVDVGFGPDLVWLKSRTQTYGWYIYDTVRGGNKDGGTAVPGVDKECYDYMRMDATDAEVNAGTNGDSTLNGLGMNQKGFNVDIGGQAIGEAGQGTHNMAAWCWKAGGWKGTWNLNGEDAGSAAAAGLTTGDTSVLNGASINTEAGFSIVKWTQDSGGSSKNIAHGLTQAPNFVIMKHLNSTSNWFVTHTSLSSGAKVLYMNSDSDEDSSSDFGNAFPGATYTATSTTGVNGREVIMYSWHNIPGLQKFGSYTANNSSDGPFVNLGFKPAIVMVKVYTGGTNNWIIWDRARMEGTGNNASSQTKGNPNGNTLQPDDTTEEPTSGLYYVDFLNNGFKLRVGGSGALRVNGNSTSYKYVYCAWAETPHNPLYGGQPNAL